MDVRVHVFIFLLWSHRCVLETADDTDDCEHF